MSQASVSNSQLPPLRRFDGVSLDAVALQTTFPGREGHMNSLAYRGAKERLEDSLTYVSDIGDVQPEEVEAKIIRPLLSGTLRLFSQGTEKVPAGPQLSKIQDLRQASEVLCKLVSEHLKSSAYSDDEKRSIVQAVHRLNPYNNDYYASLGAQITNHPNG